MSKTKFSHIVLILFWPWDNLTESKVLTFCRNELFLYIILYDDFLILIPTKYGLNPAPYPTQIFPQVSTQVTPPSVDLWRYHTAIYFLTVSLHFRFYSFSLTNNALSIHPFESFQIAKRDLSLSYTSQDVHQNKPSILLSIHNRTKLKKKKTHYSKPNPKTKTPPLGS